MGHYCLVCLTILICEPVCCKSMLGNFRDLSFFRGFCLKTCVCCRGAGLCHERECVMTRCNTWVHVLCVCVCVCVCACLCRCSCGDSFIHPSCSLLHQQLLVHVIQGLSKGGLYKLGV
jgi:hypothetical protein